MNSDFVRKGELMDVTSYPRWTQDMVAENAELKDRVVHHPLFVSMRDGALDMDAARRFLVGTWPTIEQFPQYMGMSLQKARYGYSRGEDMARRYLVRNIRVEQTHAEHWVEWSKACGIPLRDLLEGNGAPIEVHALSHWAGHVVQTESLAVAMAATNYAIEGATGEFSVLVCSKDLYANSFDAAVQAKAMRWLKMHAHYDDAHPWEALEIITTLLGQNPSGAEVKEVTNAIRKSYSYMLLGADACMQ
jgi:pyrroloquinoline quinone (PQQ) biosynthesis protein C